MPNSPDAMHTRLHRSWKDWCSQQTNYCWILVFTCSISCQPCGAKAAWPNWLKVSPGSSSESRDYASIFPSLVPRRDCRRPPLPATAIAGFFHLLQARLSNLMKSASASRIAVHLAMWQNNVQLAISDDGEIDDHVTGTIHGGYHPLQQIADDMGGTLEISTSANEGNRVMVALKVQNDGHQD